MCSLIQLSLEIQRALSLLIQGILQSLLLVLKRPQLKLLLLHLDLSLVEHIHLLGQLLYLLVLLERLVLQISCLRGHTGYLLLQEVVLLLDLVQFDANAMLLLTQQLELVSPLKELDLVVLLHLLFIDPEVVEVRQQIGILIVSRLELDLSVLKLLLQQVILFLQFLSMLGALFGLEHRFGKHELLLFESVLELGHRSHIINLVDHVHQVKHLVKVLLRILPEREQPLLLSRLSGVRCLLVEDVLPLRRDGRGKLRLARLLLRVYLRLELSQLLLQLSKHLSSIVSPLHLVLVLLDFGILGQLLSTPNLDTLLSISGLYLAISYHLHLDVSKLDTLVEVVLVHTSHFRRLETKGIDIESRGLLLIIIFVLLVVYFPCLVDLLLECLRGDLHLPVQLVLLEDDLLSLEVLQAEVVLVLLGFVLLPVQVLISLLRLFMWPALRSLCS